MRPGRGSFLPVRQDLVTQHIGIEGCINVCITGDSNNLRSLQRYLSRNRGASGYVNNLDGSRGDAWTALGTSSASANPAKTTAPVPINNDSRNLIDVLLYYAANDVVF